MPERDGLKKKSVFFREEREVARPGVTAAIKGKLLLKSSLGPCWCYQRPPRLALTPNPPAPPPPRVSAALLWP